MGSDQAHDEPATTSGIAVARAAFQDATKVLRSWPSGAAFAVCGEDDDGHHTLLLIGADGLLQAAIVLTGDRHIAIYTIADGSSITASGTIDVSNEAELLRLMSMVRERAKRGDQPKEQADG